MTAAAQKLGYTQSGVSHLVHTLEQELGVQLLIRSKAGVELSPEGNALIGHIRRLIAAENAVLGAGLKYLNRKPIIIYGSSIVHGTAATRPGLIYTNILSRYLNMDVVNLGFSGNAKAEDAVMDYIAAQDMLLFVLDYDHNAPNPEYLRSTHYKAYAKVRAAHPDMPIIMVTRPNVATNGASAMERKDVVIDTYRAARDAGDSNVYYVDGESFFLGKYENECTMDGVHPNDLGFTLMAEGIESEIRRALRVSGASLD